MTENKKIYRIQLHKNIFHSSHWRSTNVRICSNFALFSELVSTIKVRQRSQQARFA